jgi:hypothetical protein
MKRQRLGMASLLVAALCVAIAARAGQFAPLHAPGLSGTALISALNRLFGGQSASMPQLQCSPGVYLPTPPGEYALTICHGCSATNPCSAGDHDLIAIADPEGNWNCNADVATTSEHYESTLDVDRAVGNNKVWLLARLLPLPESPTGVWRIRYDATVTATVTGPCSVGLQIDNSVVRAVEMLPAAGTIKQSVSLSYETTGNAIGLQLVAQGGSSNACTIMAVDTVWTVPATWAHVTATPG